MPAGAFARLLRARCALACALLCTPPLAARAQGSSPAWAEERTSSRPLSLRTQGSVRELFLDMTIDDARPYPALELRLQYGIANDWGIPTALHRDGAAALQLLDEQADALTAAVRVPWSRLLGAGGRLPGSGRPLWERVSTTLEGRLTLHWGGWSDEPIESWHDLVGAFNFNRADYARNQIRLFLGDPNGPAAFDVSSPRLALGDVVARTQATLLEGGFGYGSLEPGNYLPPRWAVALRVDVKAPTGRLSRLGGSGGWDAGAGLVATAELFPWLTAHAMVALSAFSPFAAPIALQPKTWHTTAELSLAASAEGFTFLLEDRIVSPLLAPRWERQEEGGNNGLLASTYFGSFRNHNQVTWGLRRGRFSFWLSEDFTPGDNSRSTLHWLYNSNAPDVVIGVAFTQGL